MGSLVWYNPRKNEAYQILSGVKEADVNTKFLFLRCPWDGTVCPAGTARRSVSVLSLTG